MRALPRMARTKENGNSSNISWATNNNEQPTIIFHPVGSLLFGSMFDLVRVVSAVSWRGENVKRAEDSRWSNRHARAQTQRYGTCSWSCSSHLGMCGRRQTAHTQTGRFQHLASFNQPSFHTISKRKERGLCTRLLLLHIDLCSSTTSSSSRFLLYSWGKGREGSCSMKLGKKKDDGTDAKKGTRRMCPSLVYRLRVDSAGHGFLKVLKRLRRSGEGTGGGNAWDLRRKTSTSRMARRKKCQLTLRAWWYSYWGARVRVCEVRRTTSRSKMDGTGYNMTSSSFSSSWNALWVTKGRRAPHPPACKTWEGHTHTHTHTHTHLSGMSISVIALTCFL